MKKWFIIIFIFIILLGILFWFLFHKPQSIPKNDLVKIFASYELGSEEENLKTLKKYNLDNPQIRQNYYDQITAISNDNVAFEAFMKEVDHYKQTQIANKINNQNK